MDTYTFSVKLPVDTKFRLKEFKREYSKRKGKTNFPEIIAKILEKGIETEKQKWQEADKIIES